MEHRFPSGPIELAAHLSLSSNQQSSGYHAVVIAHGFPAGAGAGAGAGGAAAAARTYPELADRIAAELDWMAMAFCFRGAGESGGHFSLGGWLADLSAAIDHLAGRDDVAGVWVVGFGTGGALAVCAAARDPRVRGVAAMGAPADFDDWAGQPRRLLEHAREIGLVKDPAFPSSLDAWSRDLRTIRAVQCVADLVPRPLLVVHGTDDMSVPDFDARVIADAHGSAEMRIIPGAGHQLRHDPRAVAMLMGWLDRQRHAVSA